MRTTMTAPAGVPQQGKSRDDGTYVKASELRGNAELAELVTLSTSLLILPA